MRMWAQVSMWALFRFHPPAVGSPASLHVTGEGAVHVCRVPIEGRLGQGNSCLFWVKAYQVRAVEEGGTATPLRDLLTCAL